MLPSEFLAQVDSAVRLGHHPRPSIRTRNQVFTPVLGAVLASEIDGALPSDEPGLALANVLSRIAQGELTDGRQLVRTLRTQRQHFRRYNDTALLFQLLHGALELAAYEAVRARRLLVGASAEEAIEIAAGLSRTFEGRDGDLLAGVAHFLVHAAAFIECHEALPWDEFAEAVQERLAAWGEEPAGAAMVAHAAHNLLLPIVGGPTDDSVYEAVRTGRRAIKRGTPREEVHRDWLQHLGWHTTDQLLPVLMPLERRPFFHSAMKLLASTAEERREGLAAELGLAAGAHSLPGMRWDGVPRLSFPGGPAIGRSCVLYEGGGARLLIDMGGDSFGRVPAWCPPFEDLDAVLVTHAHQDHIGGLPFLHGELGYHGPWYAHETTIACTELALKDSLELQAQRQSDTGRDTDGILARVMSGAMSLVPRAPVSLKGVRVTGFEAGHVRGSLQYLLEVEVAGKVHRTLVSGDINPSRSLSVEQLCYPDDRVCQSLDVLVVEGTNALRDEEIVNAEQGARELGEALAREVRRPILVPVMSLGRAQEVIAVLGGTGWRVGVFGLAARMTRATGLPLPANVTLEARGAARIARDRYDVLVASAGCLQGGPSRYFWEESGWDPPVILTGYLFPGTPAHARAVPFPRVRFSGHASAAAWSEYVDRFPNATRYLVHYPGDHRRAVTAGFIVPRADRVYESGSPERSHE